MSRVFLTGAGGFIGGHVLRALLDEGYSVRALIRPGSRFQPVPGCSVVAGDVRRSGELVGAIEGCRYLVHVAGAYSFSPRDRDNLYATNVEGSSGILEAARLAGVERAVVTSSSATVGPARGARPATEQDWPTKPDGQSTYHRSKIDQERAVLAARLDCVLILPTAPVGPGDARPTPTGAMVVAFMRGRIIGSLPGGLNVVAVEDVARAHVRALKDGEIRERYLVGGENLGLTDLWRTLATVTGRKAPRLRVPYPLALGAGMLDELRCRALRGAVPSVPLEGVRMARHRMFVDDSRARRELGHRPLPAAVALERSVRWYADHQYGG